MTYTMGVSEASTGTSVVGIGRCQVTSIALGGHHRRTAEHPPRGFHVLGLRQEGVADQCADFILK